MGGPGISVAPGARRRLQRARLEALAFLLITAGLLGAIDRGARLLGPVLIVIPALAGVRLVRAWWRDLAAQWFVAEIVLVASGWALFASAFAGLQYLSFTLIPGAFLVEVEFGRLVAPQYQAEWRRDSSEVGAVLAGLETALRVLRAEAPPALAPDTAYPLAAGGSVLLRERCAAVLTEERCPWQLLVTPAPGAPAIELAIEAPGEGRRSSRAALERQLDQQAAPLRREVGALSRKLANPDTFVQPRIADLLYDTAIAFSGRDSGVFVPVGPVARLFHVLESLASYLLFGIVVSRVATAAGSRVQSAGGRSG